MMASSGRSNDKVAKTLSNLSLTDGQAKGQSGKKSKKQVVDSWEDDDDDDDESQSDDGERTPAAGSPKVPSAPPPTPYSPHHGSLPGWRDEEDGESASARTGDSSKRRPEKTDAVARRMIAAGLGLKAPKQTEEQRAYQRSIREQEKKKRDQEKAEEQRRRDDAEKAKAAVWDD